MLDAVEANATSVLLGGFDLDETGDLLARWGVDAADDETKALLHKLTAGHPLLLRRVVEILHADGAEAGLPDSVQIAAEQAAEQVVGRLSPRTQRILACAAVLGSVPQVANELRQTITTGVRCSYTPRRHDPVIWTIGTA